MISKTVGVNSSSSLPSFFPGDFAGDGKEAGRSSLAVLDSFAVVASRLVVGSLGADNAATLFLNRLCFGTAEEVSSVVNNDGGLFGFGEPLLCEEPLGEVVPV